jgi:hypothetical protein
MKPELVLTNPVVRHQQPAGQTLVDQVQPVARRRLRGLA